MDSEITTILDRHGSDRTRLLDILRDVQRLYGYIPPDSLPTLGAGVNLSPGDVWETASFYHFLHGKPAGKHCIYLSNTVIAKMNGYQAVHDALERHTGAAFGGVDATGMFGLFETACIGLSDQEPAMLLGDVVFTRLTPEKVLDIVTRLRAGESPGAIANPEGLRTDEVGYIDALVESNVRTKGPVFFPEATDYVALLERIMAMTPDQVIDEIDESGLRGRGGAGFSTGLKWRLCRATDSVDRYIMCNADEGEPGTFKDRVLLTRSPKDVFMGMMIAAYATGSNHGVMYLRAEYTYLKDYLERQLQDLTDQNLLGESIGGQAGFDFDIRIQLGAGSYVGGDETALIESCEGKRGTPRVKPPFPVTHGYLGKPTCVNNVETFADATRIMGEGAEWFSSMGTQESTGARLLSIAGDCSRPGIYEVEWGVTLNEVLALAGAEDARAVQISGPSGECLSVAKHGDRKIAHEDIPCTGALTIFNSTRDLLQVVRDFMQFFVDESCGICVPCRVGNVDLLKKVDLVMAGNATQRDLAEAVSWSNLLQSTSRCGLGTTSPNPILTTLESFPEIYSERLTEPHGSLLASFDLGTALDGYHQAMMELQLPEAT